jgi:ribosome-associated protein
MTQPTEDRVLSAPIAADASGTATPTAPSVESSGDIEASRLHSLIIASLEDDVAQDIVSIPLAGKSSEADTMVIASGRSNRHVSAIAEKLMDRLKHDAGVIARAEGKDQADWVLIDAGDVVVHVFRPEVREFYQLEKMWMPAPEALEQAAR